MKNKTANNTLAALRKFLNSFVKDRCRTLRFKSDDDDKFMRTFNRYCEEHDIKWKQTISDNSQMNDVFERLN